MPQHVAFLRAINVTNRYVKMVDLRACLEQIGLTSVLTVIQSGNVIFDSDELDAARLEQQIEAALRQRFGFDAATFVRSPTQLVAAVAQSPFDFADPDGATLYLSLLKETPAAERQAKLLELDSPVDRLALRGRHLYWRYDRTLGKSGLSNSRVERLLKVAATRRNISTIQRLIAITTGAQAAL